MAKDLDSTLRLLHAGGTTATAEMERCLDRAHAPECQHVFTPLLAGQAAREAANPGQAHRPLAGLAVSVKELFDMQGMTTRAGSTVLAEAPPAACDAAAVQRLRAAGGAVIGRTQMVEFAFSGVGTNPHHGTPAAFDGRFGALPGPARVPGGSSSGAAVSVATGAAFIGLGSDTGGSIRIPAALCGIVGFKNTARLVPTSGAVPLSTTLDTACAMTRSVPDAVLAHEILAARRVTLRVRPLRLLRLAVPTAVMLNDLEPAVVTAFDAALQVLRDGGAVIDEIELPALRQLATLNAQGGFAAAESWAWHRQRLDRLGEQYDPRVAARIRRGQAIGAADYIDLLQARAAWIADVDDTIAGYDALLSPTVPMQAPPVAPLLASDDAFFATNARLLRNPSVVNFFDGCALSLPCHAAGQLPVGLMVWGTALSDDAVLSTSLTIESALASTGITKA